MHAIRGASAISVATTKAIACGTHASGDGLSFKMNQSAKPLENSTGAQNDRIAGNISPNLPVAYFTAGMKFDMLAPYRQQIYQRMARTSFRNLHRTEINFLEEADLVFVVLEM